MNRRVAAEWVFRGTAIAIALAAAIDPAVSSRRSTRPYVALVTGDLRRDSLVAERVREALSRRFTVVGGSFAAASATVLVGNALPDTTVDLAAPIFSVIDDAGPSITIAAVHVPSASALDARVPVSVTTHADGTARRAPVTLRLRAGGLLLDQTTVTPDAGGHALATLGFVPSAVGTVALRVIATTPGTRDSAVADVATWVRDTQRPVYFYDPRPSWMSTFVRRAIERDRRFTVTSRVVTSRNISTDAGAPPRLDDLAGMSRFDVVVIGAPDALTPADVAGLETYLRRRGGRVLLLLDDRTPSAYDRLTGASSWTARAESPAVRFPVDGTDGSSLLASEVAWPSTLPRGASTVAALGPGRSVIWRMPVGAGEVLVSGALDTWRYRDSATSSFDRVWRSVVADAANGAPPALDLRVAPGVLAPGERGVVSLTLRDLVLRGLGDRAPALHADARVTLAVMNPRSTVPVWPTSDVGELRGDITAPGQPGIYEVLATSGRDTARASFVVAADAHRARGSDRELLDATARTHGGRTLPPNAGDVAAAVARVAGGVRRVEIWHPMRSAWWLIPFALGLSAEWWSRRRRGLA